MRRTKWKKVKNEKWTANEKSRELIINIVSGIMPQTIRLGCFFLLLFCHTFRKDTIQKWAKHFNILHIHLFKLKCFFSLINYFHLACLSSFFLSRLILSNSDCKQTRNMRIRMQNTRKIFTIFNLFSVWLNWKHWINRIYLSQTIYMHFRNSRFNERIQKDGNRYSYYF